MDKEYILTVETKNVYIFNTHVHLVIQPTQAEASAMMRHSIFSQIPSSIVFSCIFTSTMLLISKPHKAHFTVGTLNHILTRAMRMH